MPEELMLRPSDCGNLAGTDTGRDHLSHSKLSRFLNCGRMYELDYIERLEPIARRDALSMGSAFQKSIEKNDPYAGADELRALASIRTQEDEDKVRIQEQTVISASALYLSKWPAPTNEQREYEYLIRLRNPWTGAYSRTFDLLGYADGVEDHGEYLEMTENKFVGQFSEIAVKRLKLDRQVSLTCYGLWRATGKPVRVVNYRMTRKPSIKQKKDETIEQYRVRLKNDYATPDRRDFYLHEEKAFRDDEDLLRIEAELWTWAEQMRESARAKMFTRNTSHCHDYGGCAFIPICSGEDGAMGLYQTKLTREEREALTNGGS